MKKSALLAIITAAAILLSGSVVYAGEGDPSSSYTHTDAEYEDSGISLWFDYASEKTPRDTNVNTGKESFSVYMAKNEIENAQFFLCADTAREGMNASVTSFTDSSGNTLDAELFIEYYHDCGKYGKIPDAIPPLSAYGAFSLEAEKSQGFLIKLRSTVDTVSGWYSAQLSILDNQGHQVKKTTVYAYVWNFALSEETACRTSINLSYKYLLNVVTGSSITGTDLYASYYNYMLENRVCAYYLPESLYSVASTTYMDNPRVTSYQYGDTSGLSYNSYVYNRLFNTFFAGIENAHRFDKAYYFANVVDADSAADLEALRDAYNSFASTVSAYKPSYATVPFNFISTYINDIDYTKSDGTIIDQIDYYGDFVNLWCSKTFAYTNNNELNTPGAKILQPAKWDSVYGTFKDRMAAKRSAGQKVWWFISWDVQAPYINYYMQTDGVAQRLLFWQQYDNDVEGFLYNFANFWIGDAANPYASSITNSAYPESYGESILLYPGDVYNLDIPVGSLRLEAMRDGIEDYQMFYMLENLEGNGSADAYIDKMTTGMVTYSTDDAAYYNARISLGNAVDKAANPTVCDHQYVNGICIKCGAIKPIIKGDINFDELVDLSDVYLIKLYINSLTKFNEAELLAADMNNDTYINMLDLRLLRLKVLNIIV